MREFLIYVSALLAMSPALLVSSQWLQALFVALGVLVAHVLPVPFLQLEGRKAFGLSFLAQLGLTLFFLPFLLGGILLAAKFYGWFEVGLFWFPILMVLTTIGIFLGALLGYGVIIFLFTWLTPNSRVLAQDSVEKPTLMQRLLGPPFFAVRRVAEWLVPRRRVR